MRYHGFVSVAIIRTDGIEPEYILEEKTPGYPHPQMVGAICLIGGVANRRQLGDRNFEQTIQREIREEFKSKQGFADEILRRSEFYRGFDVTTSRDLLGKPPAEGDLRTLVAVYESILPEGLARDFGISKGSVLSEEEGRIQVYSEDDLEHLGFMGGYDVVLGKRLEELGRPKILRAHSPGVVVKESTVNPNMDYSKFGLVGDLE